MKILLQIAKVVLTALATTLAVFSLYMLVGEQGHAHDMGLKKLFTAAGLGLGSGLVAAIVSTIVTIFRFNKANLKELKLLNLVLLLINIALVAGIVVARRL